MQTNESSEQCNSSVSPLQMLKPDEVADLLQIPLATLTQGRWRYPELFPPFVRVGRSIRYSVKDVLEWIEINMQGGYY